MNKIKVILGSTFIMILLAGISLSPLQVDNVKAQSDDPIEEDPQPCGLCVYPDAENEPYPDPISDLEATDCPCDPDF